MLISNIKFDKTIGHDLLLYFTITITSRAFLKALKYLYNLVSRNFDSAQTQTSKSGNLSSVGKPFNHILFPG
jgi:hypothetical protein